MSGSSFSSAPAAPSSPEVVRRIVQYVPAAVLLALAIATWQLLAAALNVPDYLLPPPSEIWQTTVDQHQLLIDNAQPTLKIAVAGFLLALALGLLAAIAIRYSRLIELALFPIVISTQTVPVVGLAPILVIILGYDLLPKIVIVCLVCFFPITVNTVDGFKSVDPDLTALLRTMGASTWRLFRDVDWPSALPYVFSGAKVAVTYSVIGAIFGEWAGSSEGLGYLLNQSREQFDTPLVFSAMTVLTIMGISLFLLVVLAERLLLPWRTTRNRTALEHR
jgi:ABC-type nitrate/sulfonate/bicarbonate transport system permease component